MTDKMLPNTQTFCNTIDLFETPIVNFSASVNVISYPKRTYQYNPKSLNFLCEPFSTSSSSDLGCFAENIKDALYIILHYRLEKNIRFLKCLKLIKNQFEKIDKNAEIFLSKLSFHEAKKLMEFLFEINNFMKSSKILSTISDEETQLLLIVCFDQDVSYEEVDEKMEYIYKKLHDFDIRFLTAVESFSCQDLNGTTL